MSRTVASATPGAGIVPKARSDGTIDPGFLRATDVRSLFTGLMSAKPTQALTGFSNWVNQGSATVEDGDSGMVLYAPSNGASFSARGLQKAVPASSPYTITALLSRTSAYKANYPGIYFGWTDGTKFHVFGMSSNTSYDSISVQKWSDYSTYVADETAVYTSAHYIWVQLYDDGTTVYFKYSSDGWKSLTLFSIAKASGYLGSSGYAYLVFMVLPYSYPVVGTIMSYEES